MPDELYEQVKNEIEKDIGVYSYNGQYLYLKHKARKHKLIDGMDEQLYYAMIRSLNRERKKQRDKIRTLYYSQLNTYMSKISEEIREKDKERWKLKKLPNQEKNIEQLDIKIDVLEDVYRSLMAIK